jgi:amidase
VTDLCASDAVTLAGMLRRREVSAREVAGAHIARIEVVDPVFRPGADAGRGGG